MIHCPLDGEIKVFDAQGVLVAQHRLRPSPEGWQVVPEHHARLWQALSVQTRSLASYEEALRCN